ALRIHAAAVRISEKSRDKARQPQFWVRRKWRNEAEPGSVTLALAESSVGQNRKAQHVGASRLAAKQRALVGRNCESVPEFQRIGHDAGRAVGTQDIDESVCASV